MRLNWTSVCLRDMMIWSVPTHNHGVKTRPLCGMNKPTTALWHVVNWFCWTVNESSAATMKSCHFLKCQCAQCIVMLCLHWGLVVKYPPECSCARSGSGQTELNKPEQHVQDNFEKKKKNMQEGEPCCWWSPILKLTATHIIIIIITIITIITITTTTTIIIIIIIVGCMPVLAPSFVGKTQNRS